MSSCPHTFANAFLFANNAIPQTLSFSLLRHCLVNSYVSTRSQMKGNFLQEAFLELDVPPLFLIIPYDINNIPISITML